MLRNQLEIENMNQLCNRRRKIYLGKSSNFLNSIARYGTNHTQTHLTLNSWSIVRSTARKLEQYF
jgi:hypothetical protein